MESYSISQVAQRFGVEPHTLRFYEKEGIIHPGRTKNGIRVYSQENVAQLEMAMCLKSTGMPLKEIKRYFDLVEQGDATLEERLHIFTDHHQRVLQEIEELQHYLEKIEWKIDYLKHAWIKEKRMAFSHPFSRWARLAGAVPPAGPAGPPVSRPARRLLR